MEEKPNETKLTESIAKALGILLIFCWIGVMIYLFNENITKLDFFITTIFIIIIVAGLIFWKEDENNG